MTEEQNYRYEYTLGGYRAVESAKIDIESITVVAGINGCGKSTLSRWLYYTTDVLNSYNTLVYADYLNSVWQLSLKYDNVKNELSVASNKSEAFTSISLPHFIAQIALKPSSLENVEKVEEWIEEKLESLCDSLEEYIVGNGNLAEVDRLLIGLGVWQISDKESSDRMGKLTAVQKKTIEGLTRRYQERMRRRSMTDFRSLIKTNYKENVIPPCLALKENDIEIVGAKTTVVRTLQGLQKVIYVESPMAVSVEALSPLWWKSLRDKMNYDNPAFEPSKEAQSLMKIISNQMGGEIRKDSLNGKKKELLLDSRIDGKIEIKDLATGFKTLSYIYRLLDNGMIGNRTLLIIDEPEAHLHPRWIAEYARILVLLNKKMGVKVFIATQSPQFIQAIRAIANKENTLDGMRFYVAEPSKNNEGKYTYRSLGQEVYDIYKSFNQIYDKIVKYGDQDYD